MIDEEAAEQARIAAEMEFRECIGVDDFLAHVYSGREKELLIEPTEAQTKLVEKLAKNLFTTNSFKKIEEEEELVHFDVTSIPRVIVHQGKLLKKSSHTLVQHFQKRILYLLNDVLLITSSHATTGSLITKSFDKFGIHQVLPLEKVCVNNMSYLEPHEMNSFEVICQDRAGDRVYEFLAETESEKRIWVEKIIFAVHSSYSRLNVPRPIGWQHKVAQGTLHSSAFLNQADRVNLHLNLLAGRSPDVVDESGMCPIHWAAFSGNRIIVTALLDTGSEVDCLNNGLNSALLLAASQGHEMVVSTCLERGADPFLRNLKDRDALFMSALYASNSKGLAKIFMFLHFRGVDFNRLDSTGSSPLHECASRNLPRSVRLLVDTGAEVNNKHGRSGMTPLQFASSSSAPEVETVRSLLEKGAFPNWRDSQNMTAFEHVLIKNLMPVKVSASQERTSSKAHVSKAGSSPVTNNPRTNEDLAQTVQDVGMFVVHALPVLIEIARRGGRYTEESISHLRPSFHAAIDSGRVYWNRAEEPDYFVDFVKAKAKGSLISDPSSWTSDSASDSCMLCVSKFGYFGRHHCRSCGILCCQLCSSKRLVLVYPPEKKTGDRLCDGCFNRLTAEAEARMFAVAKASKALAASGPVDEPDESSSQTNRLGSPVNAADISSHGSSGSFDSSVSGSASPAPFASSTSVAVDAIPAAVSSSSGTFIRKSQSQEALSKLSGAAASPSSVKSTISETSELLTENIRVTRQVAEKSEALMEGAKGYSRMTRQLKESVKQQYDRKR